MVKPAPGILHTCRTTWPPVTAFEYGRGNPTWPVVLYVGGLGDTLQSIPYLSKLADVLEPKGWRVAQARPTSAGMSWGGVNVERDAQELADCTKYFQAEGAPKIVLAGFSTGCQDAIASHHAQGSHDFTPLAGVVLQAPVSDREIEAVQKFVKEHPREGTPSPDPSSFIPPSWSKLFHCWSGVTYARWWSLTEKPVSDEIDIAVSEDFFSSDLSDTRLRNVFSPLKCPVLVVLSGADPSYPPHVKADLPGLLDRFRAAAPTLSPQSTIIAGAGHLLGNGQHADEFIERLTNFVVAL